MLKPCSQPLQQGNGLSPCGQAIMQARPLIMPKLKDGMENVYRLCLANSSFTCVRHSLKVFHPDFGKGTTSDARNSFINIGETSRNQNVLQRLPMQLFDGCTHFCWFIMLYHPSLKSCLRWRAQDGQCRGQFLQIGNILQPISAG